MNLREFAEGMAVYKSCGGIDLDEFTMKSWYSMLKDIPYAAWQSAVLDICEHEKSLALINFVAEVKARVRSHCDKRQLTAWKEDRKKYLAEPQADKVEVKAFMEKFCRGMKSVDGNAKAVKR